MAGTRDIEAGKRLRHFRESFVEFSGHGGQTRFARKLGLGVKTYNNAERGIAVSKQTIAMIVRYFQGVDEAYFWRGATTGLSFQMAERLGLVGKDSTED